MWFWVSIISILVIIFLSWVVYRLIGQVEQLESDVEWFNEWYEKFITSLAEADVRMEQVDKGGSFSSDDEIGFAYKTVKDCIENLNQMGVITYGGEEGQTDSTEEIQGKKEEE